MSLTSSHKTARNKQNLRGTENYFWYKIGDCSKKLLSDLLQKFTNTAGSLVALFNFYCICYQSIWVLQRLYIYSQYIGPKLKKTGKCLHYF